MICSLMDINCNAMNIKETNNLIDSSLIFMSISMPVLFYGILSALKEVRKYVGKLSTILKYLSYYCFGVFISNYIGILFHFYPNLAFNNDYDKFLQELVKAHNEPKILWYHIMVVSICIMSFWLAQLEESSAILIEESDKEESTLRHKISHYTYLLGLICLSLNITPLFFMLILRV